MQGNERRRWMSLALWGLAGVLFGAISHAAIAYACDCWRPPWEMKRVSVSSTHPDVDHEALWPESATIDYDTYGTDLRFDYFGDAEYFQRAREASTYYYISAPSVQCDRQER